MVDTIGEWCPGSDVAEEGRAIFLDVGGERAGFPAMCDHLAEAAAGFDHAGDMPIIFVNCWLQITTRSEAS